MNHPSMRPVINPVSNIVHYGHPGIVDSVMVDGEFLMLEGKVICLDEQAVAENAQAAVQSAWQRLHRQSPDVPLPESLRPV